MLVVRYKYRMSVEGSLYTSYHGLIVSFYQAEIER